MKGNNFYLAKVRYYDENMEEEKYENSIVYGESFVEAARAIEEYYGSDLYGFSIEDIVDTEYNILPIEEEMYEELKKRN